MMRIVTIESANGKLWWVDANSAVTVRDDSDGAINSVFGLHREGERVKLQAFRNERFVGVHGSDRSLWAISDAYEFPTEGDNVLLGAAIGDEGKVVASDPGERFKIHGQGEAVSRIENQEGCCGISRYAVQTGSDPQTGDARVVWNDPQHFSIADKAFDLTWALRNSTIHGKAAKRLRDAWARPEFKSKVLGGLHDADEKAEYIGKILEIPLYYLHFYDAITHRSYINPPGDHRSAKTQFMKFYAASLEANNDTAYNLGLALHYLTDISQPMHASSFPNVFGGSVPNPFDWRHTWFEGYADKRNVLRPPLPDEPVPDAEAIFDDMANKSRAIWDGGLRALVLSTPLDLFAGNHFDARADPHIDKAVKNGYFNAGRFLLRWAADAR